AADRPTLASFYPLAVFSPEWQAITFALERDVPVRLIDLPGAIQLATRPLAIHSDLPTSEGGDSDENEAVREDPIAMLARASGYDEPERWWEDMVEQRRGGDPF